MTAEQLSHLADLAEGLVDAQPLRSAASALQQPVRIVLLGRVGAGKTTLFNAWAGRSEPVGLGGTTEVAHVGSLGAAQLHDTPGIDDPDASIVELGELLATADRVVWVVDGLQPLTASERTVVDTIVDSAVDKVVIVSRAELLEPADAEAVAARVRSLVGVDPTLADLRRSPPGPPSEAPGLRRHGIAQAALDELRLALVARGPDPDLAALRLSLRDRVRRTVAHLTAAIDAGKLPDKGAARAALVKAAGDVHRDLCATLPPPNPQLPLPEAPSEAVWDQLRQRVSGREGARRVLEAEAGRWLMEGQLALGDWWDDRPELHEVAARRAALQAALAEVGSGAGDGQGAPETF